MYLYLSSLDSLAYFPQNNFWDFTVELPKSINTEDYQLALTHIFYKGKVQDYCFVYCDAVESSVVKGGEDCVLGAFYDKGVVDSPHYLNLITNSLKRIRIKVVGGKLSAPNTPLFLTLHLREK